jgi:hypothetical protein
MNWRVNMMNWRTPLFQLLPKLIRKRRPSACHCGIGHLRILLANKFFFLNQHRINNNTSPGHAHQRWRERGKIEEYVVLKYIVYLCVQPYKSICKIPLPITNHVIDSYISDRCCMWYEKHRYIHIYHYRPCQQRNAIITHEFLLMEQKPINYKTSANLRDIYKFH